MSPGKLQQYAIVPASLRGAILQWYHKSLQHPSISYSEGKLLLAGHRHSNRCSCMCMQNLPEVQNRRSE
jgi:hypothetical protein